MKADIDESASFLSQADQDELNKLVTTLELENGTTIIFAVAPECGPHHPVIERLISLLTSDETFDFENFFYSDQSLYSFLYSPDETEPQTPVNGRKLVMAFGIEQLPTPRLVNEMKQLNLGRDSLFSRDFVLIFWLNKTEFLDEFRSRAPDFWDWRGKVVKFETRPPLNSLWYPYLEWLIIENSYLKMGGVMQVQRQVDIFLDQIYVSLQAQRRQEVTETSDLGQHEFEMAVSVQAKHRPSLINASPHDLDEPCYYEYEPVTPSFVPVSTNTKTVTQKVDLSQAVRENQYSIILGAPGAGKTTLLRYLALHFATAKRDGKETVLGGAAQEELGKPLLPVFFRIADYAERLSQQPDLSLLEYLCQFYRQWEAHLTNEAEAGTEVATLLQEQMRQGQCLMLLDGLDEVFDQDSRKQIVERINQFVEAFSANKFVITSRIAGYRDVKLSSRFTEFTIEDMGSEQVKKFLKRWCRTIEEAQQPEAGEEQWQRKGDAEAQAILDAIKASEGVKRLTANPLLLTILALIHRNVSHLPHRRVELYALAVKTLTEDWQLGKKLPDAPKVMLKESEVVELLAPLAYWMHEEKPSGLVTQAEVEERLAMTLAELNDTDPESDSVQQAVEQFLRKVRETTGLFVERTPGVYGFMHLTFEEYFAARHIANNDDISETINLIRSHLYEPRWNEPILLALGYLSGFFSTRVNKLVEQLFSNLDKYDPVIQCGDIRIRNGSTQDTILSFPVASEDSTIVYKESTLMLKELMFVGQILNQVEVNSRIRSRLVEKLILTYLGLPELCGTNTEDSIASQLLRLLRQIEAFTQKREVIDYLKKVDDNPLLPEWKRMKAQLALLHMACDETGTVLVSYMTEVIEQLNPFVFGFVINTCGALGEEMTLALEKARQNGTVEQASQQHLIFMTALSYMRKDYYDNAISLLEELTKQPNEQLKPFITWALAIYHWMKNEGDRALNYYQQTFDQLQLYPDQESLCCFWEWWSACYLSQRKYKQSLECGQQSLAMAQRLKWSNGEEFLIDHMARVYQEWKKYEQAVECKLKNLAIHQKLDEKPKEASDYNQLGRIYQAWGKYDQAIECELKNLAIRQQLEDQPNIASAYFQLGRTYQAWGKYQQAITYHQQSRDLYVQLGQEKDVANLWYNLADCYRDWGKYEQAVECSLKALAIRQQLEDQPNIASAYHQLGRIYQAWGKYEQAISYHQQSCDLYTQLEREKDVANQWYWLAVCYRDWGKYEQAVECEHKDLALRQQLEDQPKIASAYHQLGRIHQAWGKYEQVIAYYQQSRDLYTQLERDKDVADLWYWLAICYRDWGKYEQAVECEHKDLAIRQQLEDQPNIADAYRQLGRIHQAWGKYEQAIAHYQQSRDLYAQLERDKDVANLWYWLAACYKDWGKYQQAVEYQQQCSAVRQTLDDQSLVAVTYYQLGSIYQDWGKYEQAIAHHQQSRDLYAQLEREQNVANQDSWLASCYQDSGDYIKAIEYYQQSRNLYQQLGQDEHVARLCRQLGDSQCLLAKNTSDRAEAFDILAQAEENINQAVQLNTVNDYKKSLAYDYTTLSLLYSERLRLWPFDGSSLQEQITQFEEHYNTGLAYLAELGQIVERVEEALKISRAYLEIKILENLDQAEEIAHESLQVFQDYNRRKLEADARKLLGEIYLSRTHCNQPNAEVIAHQFLSESLQIYRELDLSEKAAEVEVKFG